jgi:O-antigen/teichoic acid export membrane protein
MPIIDLEREVDTLTNGTVLARNSVINIGGRLAPMGVAIFAIPVLLKQLGTDRFGVLTLIWMAIGYFSLLDFGVGRALTQLVSERLGRGDKEAAIPLIWTGLLLMTLLGLAGSPIVCLLSPWLISYVLKVPVQLQTEALYSFYLLGLSIPIVITTTGLIAILEAQQRFGLVNSVRFGLGMYMYLSPLLVLPFSKSLFPVVAVLALGRVLALLVYVVICLRVMPGLRSGVRIDCSAVRAMTRFGGWITVSNILDAFMTYLDRVLIGSMVSMTAVAYYTTPYEVVTKLWILPIGITGVFYPAFSTSYGQNPNRTAMLFGRAAKGVFILLFPITLSIVVFAKEGLDLWLGGAFARNSAFVLQCLTIGVFINSLARIPHGVVQALGRPDLTGKLHIAECAPYLLTAWLMIACYGIKGAAIAWLLRVTVETMYLFWIVPRLLQNTWGVVLDILIFVGIALVLISLAAFFSSLGIRVALLFVTLAVIGVSGWYFLLTADDRVLARRIFTSASF